MIEALACGTPVLAFPEGAATEIVIDGENGFLVSDERDMSDAIGRIPTIDPQRCRDSVATRYGVGTVAQRYETVYRSALAASRGTRARRARRARRQIGQPPTEAPVLATERASLQPAR
jgi:hypothetical protein